MTQALILKVTADGTTTSPVVRGKWIFERHLGQEIPPPPPVPAIEPDIREAVTIREQLDKHRADAGCAACHSRIDPPGFALESFDVFGGWRDRYRAVAENATPAPGRTKEGYPFAFRDGPPVDPAGEFGPRCSPTCGSSRSCCGPRRPRSRGTCCTSWWSTRPAPPSGSATAMSRTAS